MFRLVKSVMLHGCGIRPGFRITHGLPFKASPRFGLKSFQVAKVLAVWMSKDCTGDARAFGRKMGFVEKLDVPH